MFTVFFGGYYYFIIGLLIVDKICMKEFSGNILEDFLGGTFWEKFFGRIFWEDFFGGGILCLHC